MPKLTTPSGPSPKKVITVVYPMVVTEGHGFQEITQDGATEAVKFHLKNILLTNPGENLSDPDFGVGLKSMLFELETSQTIKGLRQKILNQIQKYANYFSKLNVIVDISQLYSNTLTVRIEFEFGITQLYDTLEVTVSI